MSLDIRVPVRINEHQSCFQILNLACRDLKFQENESDWLSISLMLTYPLVILSWREKMWSEEPIVFPRIPSAPVVEE